MGEATTMKILCVILSFVLLLTGCYSYSSIGEDESVLDDMDARFRLTDGSLLESRQGNHSRIEGGYQVSGTLTKEDRVRETWVNGVSRTVQPFTGMIQDSDIQEISAYQYQAGATTLAIVIASPVVIVACLFLFNGQGLLLGL
jgi:hypothetical protein